MTREAFHSLLPNQQEDLIPKASVCGGFGATKLGSTDHLGRHGHSSSSAHAPLLWVLVPSLGGQPPGLRAPLTQQDPVGVSVRVPSGTPPSWPQAQALGPQPCLPSPASPTKVSHRCGCPRRNTCAYGPQLLRVPAASEADRTSKGPRRRPERGGAGRKDRKAFLSPEAGGHSSAPCPHGPPRTPTVHTPHGCVQPWAPWTGGRACPCTPSLQAPTCSPETPSRHKGLFPAQPTWAGPAGDPSLLPTLHGAKSGGVMRAQSGNHSPHRTTGG